MFSNEEKNASICSRSRFLNAVKERSSKSMERKKKDSEKTSTINAKTFFFSNSVNYIVWEKGTS